MSLTKSLSFSAPLNYPNTHISHKPTHHNQKKENTFFQIIGFIILVVLSMQFVFSFISNGIHMENVSLWGDDYSELFGVCLFNFAVVLAIPAWLYEKKPSVNVNTGKLRFVHK
jgi:hypothetical protein